MPTSDRTHSIQYIGAVSGILSIILYLAAVAISSLPDALTRLFAFAFPLLWIISFLGLYRFLAKDHEGASLQIAVIFGIIGAAIACTFLVIQQGNLIWYEQTMQDSLSEEAKDLNRAVLVGVDKVQGYMDVAFDIFITIAWILFGVNIAKSPHFGRILGYSGSLIAFMLLVFNLYTFPFVPAEAGLIDLGPFLGLWTLIFYISFFIRVKTEQPHL